MQPPQLTVGDQCSLQYWSSHSFSQLAAFTDLTSGKGFIFFRSTSSAECRKNISIPVFVSTFLVTFDSSTRQQVRERLKKMGPLQPMNIFLRQEIDRMQRVISLVRNTLTDLKLAIDGTIIMSENLRDALDCMYDARIPARWMRVRSGSSVLLIFTHSLVYYLHVQVQISCSCYLIWTARMYITMALQEQEQNRIQKRTMGVISHLHSSAATLAVDGLDTLWIHCVFFDSHDYWLLQFLTSEGFKTTYEHTWSCVGNHKKSRN